MLAINRYFHQIHNRQKPARNSKISSFISQTNTPPFSLSLIRIIPQWRKKFAQFTLTVIQISNSIEFTLCAVAFKLDGRVITANIWIYEMAQVELVTRRENPHKSSAAPSFLGPSWETRNQRFPCVRNSPLAPRNIFPWTASLFHGHALTDPSSRTTFLALGTTVPVTANLSNLPQLTVALESALVSLRSRDCTDI